MRKKVIILLIVLSMVFPISALAVDQRSNAEVTLGYFDIGYFGSWTSDYCTATQTHMNLRMDVTSGGAYYKVQYRAPNGTWKNLTTNDKDGYSNSTYNINVKKGYDYRLKVNSSLFVGAKGQVWCW